MPDPSDRAPVEFELADELPADARVENAEQQIREAETTVEFEEADELPDRFLVMKQRLRAVARAGSVHSADRPERLA